MSLLQVDHVTKIYPSLEPGAKKGDEFVVFEKVNFTIQDGEFISMIGHSGCGKSTLLNIMAGFDDATHGGVILDGKEMTTPGLDRMVVFQNFALMPWKTAFENVALAVKRSRPEWSRSEVKEWTMRYLQMMNLESAANRRPSMLSGGMRQRVGLARAFAAQPKILLLDEPFAQIDALTRGSIQEELLRMWEATKSTVFMVTHDVDEAILLSDRIAMMSSGPSAELSEIVEIDLPRPRVRAELIDDPRYIKIRSHILKFLVSGKKKTKSITQLNEVNPVPLLPVDKPAKIKNYTKMTKLEMTEAIMVAKCEKNLTWAMISAAVGLSDVFVASVALGQNSLVPEDAQKMADVLGLDEKVATALTVCPMKAVDTDLVSKDPLIYRFFEIAYVYGTSLKEVIHEKFGDGIMSAIDFTMDVEKLEDPKGDRVIVTMNGKFLPYKKW